MNDLTTRTPAYQKAAERFNAERELGRRVLEILRDTGNPRVHSGMELAMARKVQLGAYDAARALGLLPEARS